MRNPFQKIEQKKVVQFPRVDANQVLNSIWDHQEWWKTHGGHGWRVSGARVDGGLIFVTFKRTVSALWAFIFDNGGDA